MNRLLMISGGRAQQVPAEAVDSLCAVVPERFRSAYEQSPLSRVYERNQTALRGHDTATTRKAAVA